MAKGRIKEADRIQVANQLTLKQIILDYPGGPKVITRVLQHGRGREKSQSQNVDMRKTQSAIAGFQDGKGQ